MLRRGLFNASQAPGAGRGAAYLKGDELASGGDIAHAFAVAATGWSRRLKPNLSYPAFAAGLIIRPMPGHCLYSQELGGGCAESYDFRWDHRRVDLPGFDFRLAGLSLRCRRRPDGNVYVADNLFGTVNHFSGSTGGFIDQFIPAGTRSAGFPIRAGIRTRRESVRSGLRVRGLWLCRCLQRNRARFSHSSSRRTTALPVDWTIPTGSPWDRRRPVHHGRDQRHRRFRPAGNFLEVLVPLGAAPVSPGCPVPPG